MRFVLISTVIVLFCVTVALCDATYSINITNECTQPQGSSCDETSISGSIDTNDDWDNQYLINVKKQCIRGVDNTCAKTKYTGDVKYAGRTFRKSCFPEDTIVLSNNGFTFMSDVKVGDKILAYDSTTNENVMSEVITFFHYVVDTEVEYHWYESNSDRVYASHDHNVAIYDTDDNIQYIFAKDVKVGNKLVTANNNSTLVEATGTAFKKGMYAPLTKANNFYVAGDKNMFLVHCFAVIAKPTEYETYVQYAMSIGQLFDSDVHKITSNNFLHPVASKLMALYIGNDDITIPVNIEFDEFDVDDVNVIINFIIMVHEQDDG